MDRLEAPQVRVCSWLEYSFESKIWTGLRRHKDKEPQVSTREGTGLRRHKDKELLSVHKCVRAQVGARDALDAPLAAGSS